MCVCLCVGVWVCECEWVLRAMCVRIHLFTHLQQIEQKQLIMLALIRLHGAMIRNRKMNSQNVDRLIN